MASVPRNRGRPCWRAPVKCGGQAAEADDQALPEVQDARVWVRGQQAADAGI